MFGLSKKISSPNESESSGSSLERLSRAFGFDSSLTKNSKPRKHNSFQEDHSQELVRSLLTRTLSFMNEDEEERCESTQSNKKTKRDERKRLRYKNSFFFDIQRQLGKSHSFLDRKETSLYSTQDSKQKQKGYSFGGQKIDHSVSSKERSNTMQEIKEIRED